MITRTCIIDEQRTHHTAETFGIRYPLYVEPTVFLFADRLSPDYRGGYWHFYTLSNGGFYMAPDDIISFAVTSENGYAGTMSADAFGITACLYAYSHLSFSPQEGLAKICARHFHRLREYMLNHAEVREILAAID